MAQQKNGNVALCPECEGPVKLGGKLQIGRKLSCRRCGVALVIVDRKPLELDLADSMHPGSDNYKTSRKKEKYPDSATNKQIEEGKESPQMSSTSPVLLANCPECSATLRFHRPLKERQLVVCPECDETLEVVSLHPLELHWANEDPWEYEEYENSRYHSRSGQR
jgi:lysine biosynthesis protein LysW